MLSFGDVIENRYTVLKTIGEGAFGTVYLVSDSLRDGDWFALKEMVDTDIPAAERKDAVELFTREAEMLKSLNHPGLPRYHDNFTTGNSRYIVMEYIEGDTLEDRLERSCLPFNWEEVLPWAEELCMILLYLHTRKPEPVVFRDLKPSNMMIDIDGRLKLIDFGIARHYSSSKVKDTYFMGTPGFSPPEQYGRGQSDGRSDIFALGATLYRLLTKTDMEQYSVKFPPLAGLSPSVPLWLDKVIMKCLAVNPGERYQSVQALYGDMVSRQFTSGKAGNVPELLFLMLPNRFVRMASILNTSLSSSVPVIQLKAVMVIMALLMPLVLCSFYVSMYIYIKYYINAEQVNMLKCFIWCLAVLSVIYWSCKSGLIKRFVLKTLVLSALFFSARPLLKKVASALHMVLTLIVIYFIANHIAEGDCELQDFINLKFVICILFSLVSFIYWTSRSRLYREIIIAGIICSILSGVMVPNFIRARAQGTLSGCKSNLKNIGTAMEMYSSDHMGLYPKNLAAITPHYLKTLPTCPDGRRMSYRYTVAKAPDIYTVWCHGITHLDRSVINMPQYDSIEGLHEK